MSHLMNPEERYAARPYSSNTNNAEARNIMHMHNPRVGLPIQKDFSWIA